MTPQVDITEAAKALGIPEPPAIEPANLNGSLPARFLALMGEPVTSGMAATRHTIYVDWDAASAMLEFGGPTPQEVIAHELIHVAQFYRYPTDADALADFRSEPVHSIDEYRANKFEAEAFARQSDYAHLVTIEGFDAAE